MCNGIFRSPVHRVVTNAERERLSLAVFYAVDGETVLEPAPGLLDDNQTPTYGKFRPRISDFLWTERFHQGKRFIQTLRIQV